MLRTPLVMVIGPVNTFEPFSTNVPNPVLMKPFVASRLELLVANSPEFTSSNPLLISKSVPDDSVTVPSSKTTPSAVCDPLSVTVNIPVASVPAENTAVLPELHPAVAAVPADEVLQGVPDPQVPVGVGPPAPLVVPFLSQ